MPGRFILTEIAEPERVEPHPDLVRAQQPTAADLVEAATLIGFFPDGSYLAGEVRVSLLTL